MMRKLTLLMLLLAAAGMASADVFLEYRMGGNAPTFEAEGFTGGSLAKNEAGLDLFNALSTIAYPSSPTLAIDFDVDTTSLATALANGSWFTFTLTMGQGGSIDTISLDAARGGTSAPRGFAIYAQVNAGAEVLVRGDTTCPTQRNTFTNFVTDLTGFSSLQGLGAGDVVTFRIPVYTTAAANSIDIDNIIVEGSPVPAGAWEPTPTNGALDIPYEGPVTLQWKAGLTTDLIDPNLFVPNPAITSHYLTLSTAFAVGTTDPNWVNPASVLGAWEIDADTNPVDGTVDPTAQMDIPAGLLPLTPDSVYFWKVDEYLNDAAPVSTDPNVVIAGGTWSFQTASVKPVVDAGNSVVTWLENGSRTINLDGDVTFVSPEDYTLWSIYNTPSADPLDPNVVIADTGAIDTTATFTMVGQYALQLYALDTAGKDDFDRMEVTVYSNSCVAAQNNPNAPYVAPEYDFTNDCVVNLDDFALFAATWLDDQRLTADEYYDAGIISAPIITINAPLDSATVSGVVTIDATVYDDYVGTNDGDGINTVWINVYQGTDPATRVWVTGNGDGDVAAPYTYDWDSVTGANPDGVYTIRVSSQSLYGFSPEEITVTLDNTP
jgi:hypothetical protein